MMMKMMMPTASEPSVTKSAKVWITSPAAVRAVGGVAGAVAGGQNQPHRRDVQHQAKQRQRQQQRRKDREFQRAGDVNRRDQSRSPTA